ncbi:hypothetical protein HK101_008259 [Irineochytrium annulatum]|nr:hypothetical protein HK101_008259 [Irineochytrium annulatum]
MSGDECGDTDDVMDAMDAGRLRIPHMVEGGDSESASRESIGSSSAGISNGECAGGGGVGGSDIRVVGRMLDASNGLGKSGGSVVGGKGSMAGCAELESRLGPRDMAMPPLPGLGEFVDGKRNDVGPGLTAPKEKDGGMPGVAAADGDVQKRSSIALVVVDGPAGGRGLAFCGIELALTAAALEAAFKVLVRDVIERKRWCSKFAMADSAWARAIRSSRGSHAPPLLPLFRLLLLPVRLRL